MSNLIVMKFGGTSVGNATRINAVADIVAAHQKEMRIVVVVSAIGGVTNVLVQAAKDAAGKDRAGFESHLEKLHKIHRTVIQRLKIDQAAKTSLEQAIQTHLDSLERLLASVYELGELTPRALDLVSSFGERMNIHLVTHALISKGVATEALEASQLIITTDQFGGARPLLEESEQKTKSRVLKLTKQQIVPVITGYMGSNKDGTITTLGRGGSDYSATILGYCLDADEVWIWTDVDGAMTADPRIVPDACTIKTLSYNEAAELSYFGAKVLHPLTIVPAARKQIPVRIKNTFHPELAGTQITRVSDQAKYSLKAISTMGSLSLITVQGRGMIGVHGIAGQVFGAMAAHDIRVLFISQASSEYSISFVVMQEDGNKAVHALQRAFRYDLEEKNIETIKTEEHLAILAVVGDGMRKQPGTAGKVFSVLGRANINIVAIAQGSSERNISLVLAEDQVSSAVRRIHKEFQLASLKEDSP